ncbi:MAG: hypothetical protein WDZ76_04350 [Pseudohongiellaceae bacterium]
MMKRTAFLFPLLALLGLTAGTAPVMGQNPAPRLDNSDGYFIEQPDATKYAVILVGPTVGDDTTDQFTQWAYALHDILVRDYGYSSDTISLLMGRGADDFSEGSRVDGACDLLSIQSQFADLKARVTEGDQVSVFLIGHGTGAQEEAKFNIVGPDITGPEFAEILDQFNEQSMVVVNTTSASYGFSTFLSDEGRVVISATRSASEKFDPVFSRYFIESLENRNGDRDKNNRVSMLEAFTYARQSVNLWYEEQGRLASEHAGLDDNGDGMFTLEPAQGNEDGRLAEIAYLDILASDDENLGPQSLALKARMRELERAVVVLRGRKVDYLENDYWQRMEQLLIELSRTTGEFNELQ